MQQDNGGGGRDNNKPQNQQDRRLKPIMQGGGGDQNNQNQQQQQQPQKCPRCESVNTKFCYYNNYSLSQPRFFCKTCRRYWTQGGTLRNVPVGGGCRKGKRTKTSSSSSSGETSRSSQPTPPPPQPQVHQNLTNPLQNMILSSNPVLRSKESGNLGSYYPSGGFLSSLSAIQTLNPPAQSFNLPLNQPLNAVGSGGGGGHGHLGGGSSSNLDLLQGFNVPSFVSQPPQHPQQIHQTQFFQMGNRPTMYHLHQPSQEMSLMNHSNRPGGGSSSHHQHHHHQQQQDWHQSFFNSTNTNPNVVSDTALWSISTSTSTSGNTNSNTTNTGSASASASLNPNQWPDLSGYGAPPP